MKKIYLVKENEKFTDVWGSKESILSLMRIRKNEGRKGIEEVIETEDGPLLFIWEGIEFRGRVVFKGELFEKGLEGSIKPKILREESLDELMKKVELISNEVIPIYPQYRN